MNLEPTIEQISKDIQYLKTCKAFQKAENAFILHDRQTRSRKHYIKSQNEWTFCGVLSLDDVAKLFI